jgi:hypothetical protein
MTETELPRLAQRPGIAGCHLLIADTAASAVRTAEKNVRPEDNVVPPWILLIEGWGDQSAFESLCQSLCPGDMFAAAAAPVALAVYQLQISLASTGTR